MLPLRQCHMSRKHSAEFKREAVRLSYEPGRSVNAVAASLGIARTQLQRWRLEMRTAGADAFPGKRRPRGSAEEEILRLRRELDRAIEERDILKKALAYFAQHRH